ncbi:MAG: hypothetical protein U1F36_03400 [Planctomycetota bacterium]
MKASFAATALFLSAGLAAQQVPEAPRLVVDIDTRPADPPSSSPSDFTPVGPLTYFVATSLDSGRELFVSLGSRPTTRMVADVRVGSASSDPKTLRAVGSRLFFFADDGVHGREPWLSDGSAAGTRMIADLTPGPTGSVLTEAWAVNGRLVFLFDDGTHGIEPWVTDGTARGTQMLADISPGAGSTVAPLAGTPSSVARDAQGREAVVFAAYNGTSIDLWRSDGTVPGTFRLANFLPAGAAIGGWATTTLPNGHAILDVTSQILFQNSRLDTWSSDGTVAGTTVVASVTPAPFVNYARNFARSFGGAAVLPRSGDLLVTDGSSSGTRHLALGGSYSLCEVAGEVQGSLWLIARDASQQTRLLRLDAQANSTVDVGPLPFLHAGQLTTSPSHTVVVGNRIVSGSATSLRGLWSIDPLAVTAIQLAEAGGVKEVVAGSNTVFFPLVDTLLGVELGVTDGTATGTALLADLAVPVGGSSTRGSFPSNFTRFGRRVVFDAATANGRELFVSDGTAAGTHSLLSGFRRMQGAVESADRMWMAISADATGSELWVTDGTAAGTRIPAEIIPGPLGEVSPPLVALGDRVLFVGNDGSHVGVFSTDAAGAMQFLATTTFSNGVGIARLGERAVIVDGRLASGLGQVFVTDGTSSGTSSLGTVPWPTNVTAGFDLVSAADRVWLLNAGASHDLQLTRIDGTPGGTQVVATFAGTASSAGVRRLVASGDALWATMLDRVERIDLRTLAVSEVMLPTGTQWIGTGSPVAVGSRLVFVTTQARVLFELWSSDGTAAGTGPIASLPTNDVLAVTVPAGGRFALVRSAPADGSGRYRILVTDGTASGTRVLALLEAGDLGSIASVTVDNPSIAAGQLWFTMQDPVAGSEPHVVELGALAVGSAAACGGAARAASLRAEQPPLLGGHVDLGGRSSVGSVAFVLLGFTPPHPLRFPLAGACELVVDPGVGLVTPALPLAGGAFRFGFDVPDLTLLDGLSLSAQAVIAPTDANLGFDLSNGVQMDLGR